MHCHQKTHLAMVCASKVLPLPVDPNIMMFDFSSFSWWLVASRMSEPWPPDGGAAAPAPEPEVAVSSAPAGVGLELRGSELPGLKPTPRADPMPAM